MGIITVNGQATNTIPADDPGLLLGLTVFETVRTYQRKIFRLEPHLRRLQGSAAQMEIALPDFPDMVRGIEEILAQDHSTNEVRIRYTITAGGQRILNLQDIDTARIGTPIRVGRLNWDPPEWLPGLVKHGSRAAWILSARQQAVDEVLLVDSDDYILEANRSNVFAVVDGVLWTPPYDRRFLPGVTRCALIQAAQRAEIPLEERALPFDRDYDEFYVSSTLKELAPVIEICGNSTPSWGPIGRRLYTSFHDLVTDEISAQIRP
jgi:branched-subunit amino acid aminotransferase/4-amino-4-deoxychorismate lyase